MIPTKNISSAGSNVRPSGSTPTVQKHQTAEIPIPQGDTDDFLEEFFREEEELEKYLKETEHMDDDDSTIDAMFADSPTVGVISPTTSQEYSVAMTGNGTTCPTCGCIIPAGALRCEQCGEVLGTRYVHEQTIYSGRQAFRHSLFWGILHLIKALLIGTLTAIPIGIIYILVAQTIGIHKFNSDFWGIAIIGGWIAAFLLKSLVCDFLSWLTNEIHITTKLVTYTQSAINVYTRDIPICNITRIVAHRNILDYLLFTCNVYLWSADGSVAYLKGLSGGRKLRDDLSALNALVARY